MEILPPLFKIFCFADFFANTLLSSSEIRTNLKTVTKSWQPAAKFAV
jgi:hypothetical protein